MWGYISSYWSPLTTCHSQDLGASSQYVVSSRHISVKILSRTVHVHLSRHSCGVTSQATGSH